MGFRRSGEYNEGGARVVVFEVGAGGPGAEVRVVERPGAPQAYLGRGGVHHVAFRTPNDEEHGAWRGRSRAMGGEVGREPRRGRGEVWGGALSLKKTKQSGSLGRLV